MSMKHILAGLLVAGLASCGGGGSGGDTTGGTPQNAILDSPLQNATVRLYRVDDLVTALDSTSSNAQGSYTLHYDGASDNEYYLITVTGGVDQTDANAGTLHALVPGIKLSSSDVNVTPLSDIAWVYSEANLKEMPPQDIQQRLDDIAAVLLAEDINQDGQIDYNDVLAFDPLNTQHTAALQFDYAALLSGNQPSLLALYHAGDTDTVSQRLDDVFGTRLSPFTDRDTRSSQTVVRLLSYGEGDVFSQDGLITFDSDQEDGSAKELLFDKSAQQIQLTATPKAGSKISAWTGCDSVSEDLSQCTFSLDADRKIVVAFAYQTQDIDPNLLDLSGVRITFIDEDTLAASFSEENDSSRSIDALSPGDYIAGDAGDGFLRQVVSVDKLSPIEFVIHTSDATLEDVVEQGSFEFTKVMTNDDLEDEPVVAQATATQRSLTAREAGTAAFEGIDGVELIPSDDPDSEIFTLRIGSPDPASQQTATRKLSDGVSGSVDGSVVLISKNGVDQVRARGEIKVRVQLDYGLSYKHRKVTSIRFIPIVTAEEALDLEVLTGLETNDKSVKVGTISFHKIRLFPLVIRPKLDLYLGMDGKLAGKLNTSFRSRQTLKAGVTYNRKSGFHLVHDASSSTDFEKYSEVVGVAMSSHITARPTMLLYGKTGPTIPLKAYIKLRSQEFGDQTSNYWKEQRCVTGLDNTAWAGVEGEIKWVTRGKIRTKIGRSIVSRLEHINQAFLQREWQVARWEIGAGCLGPKRPPKLEALQGNNWYARVSQFETAPVKFTYTVANVGEKELHWKAQYVFSLDRAVTLSKPEGVLQPGTFEEVTATVDPTKLHIGENWIRVAFTNLSSVPSPASLKQRPGDDETGNTVLKSIVFVANDSPPAPRNLVAERSGRDVITLSWDYPLNGLNLLRLGGFQVAYQCGSGSFKVNLHNITTTSFKSRTLPLNRTCSASLFAYAKDGGRSEFAFSNSIVTGDIINNGYFLDGMKGWTGAEQGTQKVVAEFFGQSSEDDHMLLAATLGGNRYSGVGQLIRVPQEVDTLTVRFNPIFETTTVTPGVSAPPSRDHIFYIALEDPDGNETRVYTYKGNAETQPWDEVVPSGSCLRVTETIGNVPGAPSCTDYVGGWREISVDISPYRGDYALLKFYTEEDISPRDGAPEDLFVLVDSLFLH